MLADRQRHRRQYHRQRTWLLNTKSYGDTKGLTCDVTDIKLEMIRINEQNTQKSGLLVSVWDFYGVRTIQNENGTSNKTSKIILMSINAIDGSIIDTSKGY